MYFNELRKNFANFVATVLTKYSMKKRFEALDILRGLTMAFMIIVNNPGSWSHVYAPLRHAAWVGCTPTDLVFPFFLFCVGMSMAWSLSKFQGLTRQAFGKIGLRTLIIFLIGLALNAFPFDHWGTLRYLGVLQRIALCYFFGAIIVLLVDKKYLWIVIAALLSSYTAIVCFFSENGFALDGSVLAKFDATLFGEAHVYHGYGCAFDPEGLLGTMSSVCNALLGYLAGCYIRNHINSDDADNSSTISTILVAGLGSLALGEILSIFIPISKPIWSASYVFYTVGWALEVLGVIMYLEKFACARKLMGWTKCFGANTITAYVLASLLAKTLNFVCPEIHSLCTNEFYSLLHALSYVVIVFAICWLLDRKKIYLKI